MERKEFDQVLTTLIDLCIDAIFIESQNGDVLNCNQSACKMFGYTKDEMLQLNIRDLVPQNTSYLKDKYTEEDLYENEYVNRLNKRKNGEVFKSSINSKLFQIEGEEYLIAFLRDMTEEDALKEKLYRYSFQDELTGLDNRRQVYKMLESVKYPIQIGMIDFDDFKEINDDYGHLVGDKFLRHFGRIVKELGIHCGRVGGEEFLVMDEENNLEQKISILLNQCRNDLKEYGGIKFSCGITLENVNVYDAIKRADNNMYEAKRLGKNQIVVK